MDNKRKQSEREAKERAGTQAREAETNASSSLSDLDQRIEEKISQREEILNLISNNNDGPHSASLNPKSELRALGQDVRKPGAVAVGPRGSYSVRTHEKVSGSVESDSLQTLEVDRIPDHRMEGDYRSDDRPTSLPPSPLRDRPHDALAHLELRIQFRMPHHEDTAQEQQQHADATPADAYDAFGNPENRIVRSEMTHQESLSPQHQSHEYTDAAASQDALIQLENRIQSKMLYQNSPACQEQSEQYSETRNAGSSVSPSTAKSQLGACLQEQAPMQSDLRPLENEVQAKVQGSATPASVSTGALAQDHVAHLDQRIAHKRGSSTRRQPLEDKLYNEDADHDHSVKDDGVRMDPLTPNDYNEELIVQQGPQEQYIQPPPPQMDPLDPLGLQNIGFEYDEDYVPDEDLAIAVPVIYEEENFFIPSAVEYDPDAKPPPLIQNRRFRLYMAFSVFLVVAIVMGVSVGVARRNSNDGSTEAMVAREIEDYMGQVIGADLLEKPNSPYARALRWILFQDPLKLSPADPTFFQRYIAAYFYYATSEEQPWLSCNPPTVNETINCEYMRFDMRGPRIFHSPIAGQIRWLTGRPECEWVGIWCDELNQIRSLQLAGTDLGGTFPGGILYLPHLQILDMQHNNLRGTIPTEIAQMNSLREVRLDYNDMIGTIPDELYYARNLQRLEIAGNNFVGSIKSDISFLRDMRSITMNDNRLTGSLPTEIGILNNLKEIWVQRNLLKGELPSQIGNLRLLTSLQIYQNEFSGTLSEEHFQARSILDVRLSDNEKLGGDIPDGMFLNFAMAVIEMDSCNFTGTISSGLSQLNKLISFQVTNNKLTGPFPTDLAKLTFLESFLISGNDLTGKVPEVLCDLRITSPFFDDLEANCRPEEEGPPQNPCREGCCSLCCDSEGNCEEPED